MNKRNIVDNAVLHKWECALPTCHREAFVDVGFYSECGNPVCGDCGGDMVPAETSEDVSAMHSALIDAESAMFHVESDGGFNTPADRDAMVNAIKACRDAIGRSWAHVP